MAGTNGSSDTCRAATLTARLKTGAKMLKQLATCSARRVFRPTSRGYRDRPFAGAPTRRFAHSPIRRFAAPGLRSQNGVA
jgi:hypothetical protein